MIHMQKNAVGSWLPALSNLFAGTTSTASDALMLLCVSLGSMAAGGGAIAAAMTAKGKNDLDNVRNEYLDARLSADVAENEQKLKNEFKARQQAQPLKSTRLFG